jgi:hypothetical protein
MLRISRFGFWDSALLLLFGTHAASGGDFLFSYDPSGSLIVRAPETLSPPQILGQPQNQIVQPSELASFSILLADATGCAYQWQFNGANLPGQTNDSLLILNVGTNNQGPYSVVVTNSSGSITSTVAQLYLDSNGNGLPDVWELAYFGNLNQTALGDFDGDGVSNLQEYLDGTNPTNKLSFRSRLTVQSDGGIVTALPAQTSYAPIDLVTLTGTPLPPNSFFGWIGDLVTRSNPAALLMNTNKFVRACFTCFPPVAGLVGWWRGETDAGDFMGGHNGAFYSGTNVVAPSLTPTGVVGAAFQFYGTNYIQVPDTPGLRPAQFTLEAWVYPNVQNGNYQTVVAKGSAVNDDDAYYLGVINGGASFWTKNSGMIQLAGGSVPANQWTHLAATFDGATKRLYVNGLLVGTQGGLGPLTYDPQTIPLTIGSDWTSGASAYLFNGSVDEAALFNRALSAFEINNLYIANCAGKCTARPVFLSPPQFVDATQGMAYTQQVITALGSLPVTFSLSAGLLPAGLSLSAAGLISGVPTVSGSNVFAILATDAAGLTTELVCGLHVLTAAPPQVVAMPAGIVSWWRAEKNALDAVGTNHGFLSNGVSFAAGEVGQAFWFNNATQQVRIPASASVNVGTNNGFSLEAWIKPNDLLNQYPLIEWNDGSTIGTHFWINVAFSGQGGPGCFYANLRDTNSTDHYFFTPAGLLSTSVWQHVALTYDRNTGVGTLFFNGAVAASVTLGIFVPRTTADLHFGFRAGFGSYAGLLDEPTLYNRVLSPAEIVALYSAGPLGKQTAGPYINTASGLPDGVVGQGYTQTIATVRGTAPVTLALGGGSLPPGLSLSAAGLLSGMPATPGAFSFTVVATDAATLSNSQSFSLQVYSPLTPPPGIAGWWRAENNPLDAIGTNNGVLRNNAGFGAGKVGQAFALNGSSQSVDIPDAPALRSASVTLEAWVLLTAVPGLVHIFAKPLGPGTFDSYGIYLNGASIIGFLCDTNGFGPSLSAPFSTALGVWHHVAYTFDDVAKQQALYVDGAQVAAGFVNKSISYDTQPFLLGRDTENGNPNFFFPGRMDEAAIYNRPLSAAEIAALYDAGPGGKASVGPYFTNGPLLTGAVVSQAYGQVLGTARGSGTASFALTGGTLPPGLSLSATGLLSGTPTATGSFSFTVTATDALGLTGIQSFNLPVFPWMPPPAGLVSWWRAESNTLDAIGGNNGFLINNATYAPGEVGQAFALNGTSDAIEFLDAASLRPASLTLEAWVMFLSSGGTQMIFAKDVSGNADSFAVWLQSGSLYGHVSAVNGTTTTISTPFTPNLGQWYHVAFAFDDSTKQQVLYLNGVAVAFGISNVSVGYDNHPVYLGAAAYSSLVDFLYGRIDEAAIYNRALGSSEIAALYNAGAAGKATLGPYFTTPPTLADTAYGLAYTQAIATVRGTPNVTYALTSGALPAGVTFTSQGLLSGTATNLSGVVPTNAVTFGFTIRATDAAGLYADQTFSLRVTAPVPPPAGLISWWRAENNALDSSGTNNATALNATLYAPGMVGQAFALDGISDCVLVPDSPSLRPASLTVECWVRFDVNTGLQVIFAKPLGTGTLDSFALWLQNGNLQGGISSANGYGPVLAYPFTPTVGQWYHLAYTYDELTRQQVLYLNNQSVASGLGDRSVSYDSNPVLLGCDSDNGSRAWFVAGRIDEASIYGRALTAAEITSLYYAGVAGKTTVGPYFATLPSLPDAILSQVYTQTIAAVRGSAPVTFTLTAGALPAGLALSPTGSLSGVPSSAGPYSFTLRATDTSGLFAVQTFSLQVYAPVLAPPGLAAWWRAENNAFDSIGTNNGILSNGVTFVTGKVGYAFNLDGFSNNVQVLSPSAVLNPTGAFSVELWAKANPQQFSPDGLWLLVDKSHGWTDGSGWAMQGNSDGTVSFFFGIGGSSAPVNFPGAHTQNSLLDNHWHHLAGVYTGSQIQLFEDSALQNTLMLTNLYVGNNRNVEIGRSWGGGSPTRYFHGLIDEVSFYTRALTPGEISAIYTAGPAGKAPPTAPILLSGSLINGWLVLSFNSTPGKSYTLQYRDSLSAGTWQTLASVTASGTNVLYTNSIATPQQRFFRVSAN